MKNQLKLDITEAEKKYVYDAATIEEMLADSKIKINKETKKEIKKISTLIETEINRINALVETMKKDYLSILGIFVSFVTFVSVEIQILKTPTTASTLIALSSLMIGGLLLFAMTLVNFVKDNNHWSNIRNPLLSMPIMFFLSGMFLYWYSA